MRGTIRRGISIIMIMLMIMPLTWVAYAEDTGTESADITTVQDTAADNTDDAAAKSDAAEASGGSSAQNVSAQTEQPSESATTEPASGSGEVLAASDASEPAQTEVVQSATGAEETEAVTETEETAETGKTAETAAEGVAEESSGSESSAGSGEVYLKASEAKKNITIAGTELDCSTSSSGSGWSYDKESETILLRDFNSEADITSDGTGVTIVTSGLNRIGTLSCDGQIDVIGSGILLIDNIELAEGSDFNLLPVKEMYGEDGGSAAVFLLQDDGSYMLINGSVAGVIDEAITTPEGLTLTMPENTKLELKALIRETKYDEDNNATDYYYTDYTEEHPTDLANTKFYRGALTVSNLIIGEGASIVSEKILDMLQTGIIVNDLFENNGTISGGSAVINGDYSGEGTFENAVITVNKGQELTISIKDSILTLNGSYTVADLKSSGSSELHYDEDTIIKNIKMSSGDKLRIYGKAHIYDANHFITNNIVSILGTIDGGTVYIGSGIAELGKDLKLINGGVLSYTDAKLLGAAVFNYSGISLLSDGITGPVFLGPSDVTVPEQNSVPVISFNLNATWWYDEHLVYEENPLESQKYTSLENFDATKTERDGEVSYDELIAKYPVPEEELDEITEVDFQVITLNDGKLSMTVLGPDSEQSIAASNIVMIRRAIMTKSSTGTGGSTLTSTLADRTGAGTIGGNAKAIIRGTGITRNSDDPDPDPVDPDDPDPIDPDDPDPIDPDDPDDPDPVRPVTVAAAAAGSLVFRVEEFDLNEGKKNAEEANYFLLTAYQRGAKITELSNSVTIAMEYDLPKEFKNKPLYAVFANEDEDSDETLKAFNAEYNKRTGMLSFETDQLGEFVVTALDFDGEEFSPEFYDELEKAEAVQPLLELLKEKEKKAGL